MEHLLRLRPRAGVTVTRISSTAQKLTFSVFRCSIYVKALFSLSFRFSLVDLFYANNPPDRTRPRDDEPDYAVIHLSGELKTDASA